MWSKKQNIKSKCPVVVTDNTLLQNEALLQITVPLGGVLHGVSLDDSITKTESSHSYGFPNSAQYSTGTCTVSSPNPDMVQYGSIPGVIDPTTVRTDSVPHCTILSPEIVPLTVPFTFFQGLKMPRRIDSHLRNKYTKIRKNSRTPLTVPRIIEHSKDADPHLDQSNPLTVITMDLENAPLAFPEPAPGVPKGTRTGVSSNPSTIQYQNPKPNHSAGGEEVPYRFSAGIHKHRPRMPVAACTTEGKIRTSYRPQISPNGDLSRMVHYVYTISSRRAKPRIRLNSSTSCVKPDSGYKPGLSLNALNGEVIPDLYSDEYEFDANEYQKWHLDYRFNLDAAASITNHKCENYASKDKSFLDLSAKGLLNKSIWMFPPIELAKEFILYYEAIRLQQPESMMAVICLPRLMTPGADYTHLVKKYKCIHTYTSNKPGD